MQLFVDVSKLSKTIRAYLPLYMSAIFTCPVSRDGGMTIIPHETLVADLEAHTVEHSGSVGLSGSTFSPGNFSSYVHLFFKVCPFFFLIRVIFLYLFGIRMD